MIVANQDFGVDQLLGIQANGQLGVCPVGDLRGDGDLRCIHAGDGQGKMQRRIVELKVAFEVVGRQE